jgi:hypothetical protein
MLQSGTKVQFRTYKQVLYTSHSSRYKLVAVFSQHYHISRNSSMFLFVETVPSVLTTDTNTSFVWLTLYMAGVKKANENDRPETMPELSIGNILCFPLEQYEHVRFRVFVSSLAILKTLHAFKTTVNGLRHPETI